MQLDIHHLLDWLAVPILGVVGYFAKLTIDNDRRIAVMEAHLTSMEEKLDEIRTDVKELKDRG